MVTALVAPLVGREVELGQVSAFLEGIQDGAATLLIEGEAGIGKTTLWRAGLERARELGFQVLAARPAESERELSFAGLGDMLRDAHDDIGHLPDPQRRALRIALVLQDAAGDPPEQRAIAAALLGLFRRLADAAPVLIAVDDLQWLDPPSSAALQFAIRRLEDDPVRLLAMSRVGFVEMNVDQRITLGPLSLQALDRLLRSRLDARFLRPTLRQLEEVSGGNPLYALEIAASLLRSGNRPEPGEPPPIPADLLGVVGARLATLTPSARDTALVAAALAQPTVPLIQRATRDHGAGVSEAVAAGILDRSGEVLRFTHPLLASTIYAESTADERRDLHRRLAELTGDSEDRARHLAEATGGPDESVASALEDAATSVARRGAPDVAARLAKRAVELTPVDRRAAAHRRHLAWAHHCLVAGDLALAETLLERQLAAAEPGHEQAEVEYELGAVRLEIRGLSAARACYERALRQLGETGELELRTKILLELADAHLGERLLASDTSDQAVALAEKLGKPELLARALGIHGWKLTAGEPPTQDYWRRAMEIEHSAGELQFRGPTHAFALETFMRGDAEAAAVHLRSVTESMRRRGDPRLPKLLLDMSDLARASGAWDDAASYADEAYDLAVQTGRDALEPVCVLYQARFALLRGDLELAREQTEAALALPERLASSEAAMAAADAARIESLAMSLFGRIAASSGLQVEAHRWFATEIETLRGLGLRDALAEALGNDIASLVALGRLAEASRAVRELNQLADVLGPPIDALAARAEGLVAAAGGDSADALGHLERALRLLEALPAPWPLEAAKTLLALGGAQRRARQKLTARHTLEQALETFESLGARLWAEAARHELQQIGGRPSRPGALTVTEKSVAELVAAGHSNAEVAHELFMSPKTVEWNLSKIYKKLHVRSRTELALKLTKHTAAAR